MLTPDQRLRVFVSSTLQELASERAAARAAIESLQLTPVMFDEGARSHPPQTIYRAYLEQSHVFVGIYWQSYGWIAPGDEVSGIEDEYRLSSPLPRLLYVKEPAPERDPRLSALLDSFLAGPTTFATFATPEELSGRLAGDLAVLLTERFESGATDSPFAGTTLPTPATSFVGRAAELDRVRELLTESGARLVTLTGPGGIGKTRLAVEAARRLAPAYRDGVVFVALDGIGDEALVWPTVAAALGLRELGADAAGAVAAHLHGRELLLVLDNFEHVIAAVPALGVVLERAPALAVLVTSRELLRLRGEHEVAVPPLAPEREAVELFGERAEAASHAFHLASADLRVVAEICRRLDGVPLAIELAAPRLRLLTPAQLLERLRERLELAGPRDAPARQQTLDAAIGWSYDLLDPNERLLFAQLGVFRGSFTLDAAEEACELPPGASLLDLLASLLDKSVVYRPSHDEARFAMLHMVRDFARQRLDEGGRLDETLDRLAGFYRRSAVEAEAGLQSVRQRDWKRLLDAEADTIRSVLSWLEERGRGDDMAALLRGLWMWFFLRGALDECRSLFRRALAFGEPPPGDHGWLAAIEGMFALFQGDAPAARAALEQARELLSSAGDARGLAMVKMLGGVFTAMLEGEEAAQAEVAEGLETFRRLGDAWGTAMSLNVLAWLRRVFRRFDDAGDLFETALATSETMGDGLEVAMALGNLAEARLAEGDVAAARAATVRALALLQASGSSYTVPDLLETLAACERLEGAGERAAELLGSSDALRERMHVQPWGPAAGDRERLADELREALGAEAFLAAVGRGREARVGALATEAAAHV